MKSKDQGTGASRSNRLARVVFRLCLIAAIFPILSLFARFHWLLDLFTHFQMQYAVVLSAGIITLAALRHYRHALVIFAIFIIPFIQLAPLYRPLPELGNRPTIRVMAFNVLGHNDRYTEVADWSRSQSADLIFFSETNPAWATRLAPLHAEFPHRVDDLREGNFGFSFFSRHPITSHRIIPAGTLELPILIAEIRHPRGDFTFIGAHPVPPTSDFWAGERDIMLGRLAELIRNTDGLLILGGDLNASRWSHAIQPLFHAGLQDSAEGHGYRSTWMRTNPTLTVPIDHVFFRGFESCPARQVGPSLGSDHRAVVADLAWPGPPDQP